jgi:autotransporter-associated beta strand protein
VAAVDTNGNDVTFANSIGNGGSGGFTKSGEGILTLLSANTYSGPTVSTGVSWFSRPLINWELAQRLALAEERYAMAANAPSIDLSARTLTFNAGNASIDTSGRDVTFANAVGNNGAGGLVKVGAGTLTLAGAGNYSGKHNRRRRHADSQRQSQCDGSCHSEFGVFKLGTGDRINDGAAINLGNATFNSNGVNETVGPLTVAGTACARSWRLELSHLHFADSASALWNGTLTIMNWSGSSSGGGPGSDLLRQQRNRHRRVRAFAH